MPWLEEIIRFLIQVLEPVKIRISNSIIKILEELTLLLAAFCHLFEKTIERLIDEASGFYKVMKNLILSSVACSLIVSNFCISGTHPSPFKLSAIGFVVGITQSYLFDGRTTYFLNAFLGPFVAVLTPKLFMPIYKAILDCVSDFNFKFFK